MTDAAKHPHGHQSHKGKRGDHRQPDRLADLVDMSSPQDVIAEAERRTREVRGAYEMLKARRSIR